MPNHMLSLATFLDLVALIEACVKTFYVACIFLVLAKKSCLVLILKESLVYITDS